MAAEDASSSLTDTEQPGSQRTHRWSKPDSNSWSRFEKTPSKTRHKVAVHCCLAEREDRSHALLDCRASVMLAGLRALRKWLLR
jgi:hypothetical protein